MYPRNTPFDRLVAGWRRPALLLAAAAIFIGLASAVGAGEHMLIRVSVLKFGTVNWELDVIRHHRLDRAEGIRLEVTGLASTLATKVALQGGATDIIVTDWIWVSRQRAEGIDYVFAPYSTSVGAVVAPADSPIVGIADLRDKRLGIAGGPLDKGWLLLRTLAERRHGFDLNQDTDKVFGAPPLLSEQLLAGRIDAVLTFWHFAARLEGAGLRRVIGVADMARRLGIETDVPLLGYVFRGSWADRHPAEVLAFFRASRRAKQILESSDDEWLRLKPLLRASDAATLVALRDGYRAGIPKRWGARERADAARLYDMLRAVGGEKLVGRGRDLDGGTFWAALSY